MIILSYNVRGLGGGVKWRAIKDLIARERVEMVLLQETKLQVVDQRQCVSLWGDSNCDWRYTPAVNSSGGLLCIWSKDAFTIQNCVLGQNFILLAGLWKERANNCVIVNVYAPCDLEAKRELWRGIQDLKQICPVASWCIGGDFNAVRTSLERRGEAISQTYGRRESDEFNSFIIQMELFDIPILGKRFKWFRPNGKAMSRLDRFLI
ncbi:uncharacterized protein LOC130712385 [Lotus japonicus]|uniref:uncharacterized protein LOC130712385 n=1 Tax=Lotus japonicus TaxID=34305 RepID=UPI0025830B04|nr:uncharacterized protein LOC130712385 [Lotus japonicus]